jgi:dTDP-D-glucose 4,6-dehydratase
MRILLTGAGGFAGAHFLEHVLATTDWDVVATDSFRHRGTTDRIAQVLRCHPAQEEAPDTRHREWRHRTTVLTHDLTAPFSPQAQAVIAGPGGLDFLIAMASESHVDRSITDPVAFTENNVAVVLNTLELARVLKPRAVVAISTDEVYGPVEAGFLGHKEWSPILPSNPYAASKAAQEALVISYWRTYGVPAIITNCYDLKTRVMTSAGLKGCDDLRFGDQVWTLDADENLVLETVQRTVRMPGDGQMIRIQGTGISQLVTRNHRMMIRRPVGNPRRWQKIEEVTAESLLTLKGRVRVPRTGIWSGSADPVFRPYEHMSPPVSRGSSTGGRGWQPAFLPQEMPTEQMAALFGWYISEGCLAQNTVRFGAATRQQQDEIASLLQGLGGREPYVNGRALCIAHGHLAELLALAGTGSRSKAIPQFIRELDTKYLQVFFDTMIAGDGSRYGAGAVYYTISRRLAEQMCEVGMKLGYSARISVRETWNPAKTVISQSYITRLTPNGGEVEARNVSEEDYDGDVWCLSVPSGRVFVERDGVISLSGQTMNLIGERQHPEKFVPKTLRAILSGQEAVIHGSPGNIGSRHYLHARSMADAVLWLLQYRMPAVFPAHAPAERTGLITVRPQVRTADRPDRYNVASPDRVDNLTLAHMIAAAAGRPLRYRLEDFHSARPGHDPHYGLDPGKITALGWKAPVPFAESLERTVRWTLRHPDWLAG